MAGGRKKERNKSTVYRSRLSFPVLSGCPLSRERQKDRKGVVAYIINVYDPV